ncbi:MAG: hypothetical protein IPI34_09350 [bacterium]|nr:hypothetical protein [bacterium]
MEQLTVRRRPPVRVHTAWHALAAQTPALPRPAGLDFQRLRLPTADMPSTPNGCCCRRTCCGTPAASPG